MPVEAKPSIHPEHDPAHPSQPNKDHTTASGEKPQGIVSALADTEFMPSLDEAPATQHAKSYFLLLLGLSGAVFAAWLMGFELFQVKEDASTLALSGAAVVATGFLVLWFTDALRIDWWELVVGYWWLSLPVAGAAGLAFVLMQESAASWEETD